MLLIKLQTEASLASQSEIMDQFPSPKHQYGNLRTKSAELLGAIEVESLKSLSMSLHKQPEVGSTILKLVNLHPCLSNLTVGVEGKFDVIDLSNVNESTPSKPFCISSAYPSNSAGTWPVQIRGGGECR